MDIVIIGSGNVATVIGRKSQAAGHRIIQVYSPNGAHANTLTNRLGANSTAYISTVEKTADLMIVALRDEAIAAFIKNLGITKSILTHTAGSLPIDILSAASDRFGDDRCTLPSGAGTIAYLWFGEDSNSRGNPCLGYRDQS